MLKTDKLKLYNYNNLNFNQTNGLNYYNVWCVYYKYDGERREHEDDDEELRAKQESTL